MKTAPWKLLILLGIIAAVMAYGARDAVQNLIVLPLAYLLWQLRGLLAGVAQLIQWGIVVMLMVLVMAWQLVPRLAPRRQTMATPGAREGNVHATALCLVRARSSNYFRWQLAHRLGRVAGQLGGSSGVDPKAASLPPSIARYLDAGLNHSFVDYAARRVSFTPRPASPMNLDPEEVVRYLELHCSQGGDLDADSR